MTLLPLRNRNAPEFVVVILAATVLALLGFEFASRSNAASARSSNNTVANSRRLANSLAAPAGTSYTWIGGTPAFTTDWQVSTNWSPVRTVPALSDVLVFNTGSPTVTNVPTQTIAELDLTGGAFVTLNAATIPSGDKTLTISGGGLSIAAGTSLTLAGSTVLTISVAPGSTGTISGQIILQDAAHKVQASDANGIKFQNGSFFTTATGFTGNPFGAGTDGSIEFQSGASSFFNAGGDPFGGSGHSIATFDLGSSQDLNVATAFSSDGRTYGNLTLDGSQSYAGAGSGVLTVFNDFTLKNGSSLTLSSSSGADLNLLGNFTDENSSGTAFSANGRTVKFQGGGLFGGTTQTINTTGTDTFGDVSISKTVGSVKLGGNLTITGALQFNGTSSAVDVLELNSKILNLNGTIGGTSTSTSNGFKGDVTGATINIGGTGALGTVRFVSGAQTLKNLGVNRTSSGSVTLGSNLTIGNASSGSLTLTEGVVNVGSSTLSLAAFPSISRTNGYVIGNLQKTFGSAGNFTFHVGTVTASNYSPVDAFVTAGSVGNSLTVKAVEGIQPNISGNALKRYWTLSNSGSVTADLTFHYLAGDVVGTEANYKFLKYNGSFTVLNPDVLNTGSHLATKNGVTSYSDWTLADPVTVFGTLRIENAPYTTPEGNSAFHDVTINVSRTGGSNGPVSIDYAVTDGTATIVDNDYSVLPSATGTLHWAGGDTANKTITVRVNGDTAYEADETVNLALSNPQGGATLGAPATTTLTILNDECPPTTTLTVNTTDDLDNGACLAAHCSLREAINAANCSTDKTTINFNIPGGDPGCMGGVCTIDLATSLPNLATDMTINGPGANLLTVKRSTAAGTPDFRILTMNGGVTDAISDMTLSNGHLASGNNGAGISNSGALTLTNVNLYGNSLGISSGSFGGGIYNTGSLTLNGCNVGGTSAGQSNTATDGGGIYSFAGTIFMTDGSVAGNVGNGIAVSGGAITLKSVSVTNNSYTGSGAGIDIATISGGGTVNVINSLVANNATSGSGGGIFNGNVLTVINSTISGNTAATNGGGIVNQGNFVNSNPSITLTNATITNNRSDSDNSGGEQGGGIFRTAGPVILKNTIVAGNRVGIGTDDDINGTVDSSSSFNLIGVDVGLAGIIDSSNGNQIGTSDAPLSARLNALANHGGPTPTHLLRPDSPAINEGNNTLARDQNNLALTTDQRGKARIVNTTVDIGAVEANYAISATAGSGQSILVNNAFATQLQATVSESGVLQSGVFVTFTAPASGASGTFTGSGDRSESVITNGSGIATASVLTANAIGGSYGVTATIGNGPPSATFNLTNNKADQAITFDPNPLPDKLFSDPDFPVNATASSGLPVSFVATGSCTVSGNTVHLTSVGSCTMTAKQAGNDTFNPAPDVVRSFNIAKGNQTITFAGPGPRTYGNLPFNVSATASSNLPVSFSIFSGPATISGNTVTLTGAGTVIVRASQAGDSNYNAAPNVDASFSVAQATTSTGVSSSINPSDLGQGVTFTVTVSSSAGTPTGTVQFTDGSNNLGDPINCVAGGGNTCTAQFSISSLTSGNHAIAASYSGDTNFAGSSGALSGGQVVTNQPALLLILEESGPDANQAAAFDSLLFVRDPFHVQSVATWLDLGSDRNTRVIIFAANLQLNQGETASNAVTVSLLDANNHSFDVPAEDVRPVPNSSFTQVRFRLHDDLAAGVCMVTIKAHGQISNTGTIRIASP